MSHKSSNVLIDVFPNSFQAIYDFVFGWIKKTRKLGSIIFLDVYDIALTILIKFIVAINAKNNENVVKFISELNESKSNIHNKK